MASQTDVVLVTGGATGIGFALAKKFHVSGAKVILVGRNEDALLAALGKLPGAEIARADLTLESDRERLLARFQHVNVLVNNAGVQFNGLFAEFRTEDIEQELNVNLAAPVLLTRAFLPLLLKHSSAAIINVSSGLAIVPKESAPVYCATKAALHSFSRSLRWQLEGTPVRVVEVLPPLVETHMTAGRGKGKITPAELADEFWEKYSKGCTEIQIGKTKLLGILNRFAPYLAERIMRGGL